MFLRITFLFAILSVVLMQPAIGSNLQVLPEKINGVKTENMMHVYLERQAKTCFNRWKQEFESLKTEEQVYEYQKNIRNNFIESLGISFERTPLNPQITGSIKCTGFKIEKIIFESQPNFYVTANLYLPDRGKYSPPYPAVLVACGHSRNGKCYLGYQKACAMLALNGIAALIYDPIDQGERSQYLDETGAAPIWGVEAHTMAGVGCILLGQNIAGYMVWDAVRCLDYLQTHNDIDPDKIGVMGNSGGGTLTSYLLCYDDRIKAAAPSCYLTSFESLVETAMARDAEQSFFGQLDKGIMHADYLMAYAPVPTLVCCATRDFFDINGTWDTFRYVKRFYGYIGLPEKVDIVEADAEHGYSDLLRIASVKWMLRWLCQKQDFTNELNVVIPDESSLLCAPEGQILKVKDAVSVYDLNRKYNEKLSKTRSVSLSSEDGHEKLIQNVITLNGIHKLDEIVSPKITVVGVDQNENCKIKKMIIEPEPYIYLPALLYSPVGNEAGDSIVIYTNAEGMSCEKAKTAIHDYLLKGISVFAVDLRGVGETRLSKPSYFTSYFGSDGQCYFLAYLLGKSYVGMRANDLLACAKMLMDEYDEIHLHAVGSEVGIPALHTAALESKSFTTVRIQRTLKSWSEIIDARLVKCELVNLVPGALKYYDLPDLVYVIKQKVHIEDEPMLEKIQ